MQGLDSSTHEEQSAILHRRSTTERSRFVFRDLFGDADVLRLRKKPEGFFAAFTADAALFHAAKGDAEIAQQPAVHPHCAGVDLFRDTMGAAEVLGPDARGEA